MEIDISYTSKEITSWGGMFFLKQMLQKIGFREVIDSNLDLPQAGSNRGYKTSTIIEGFITSIWCGANRFLHIEVTRHDLTLGKIFDWKNTPGQDTYKRFFCKFNQATNQKVSAYFYSWIFDNFKFDNFTLDIDSSVMTRYGEQEVAGSIRGWRLPHYRATIRKMIVVLFYSRPAGWHIPTNTEWTTLTVHLGGQYGDTIAGGKLKEAGTNHWGSLNTGATNLSGFTGLPGGGRGTNGQYSGQGAAGSWWSSTEEIVGYYHYRSLYGESNTIGGGQYGSSIKVGYSVRCIKD